MEYSNFKNLLRKGKYSELEEEYENQLNEKGKKMMTQKRERFYVEINFVIRSSTLAHNRKKTHLKQK